MKPEYRESIGEKGKQEERGKIARQGEEIKGMGEYTQGKGGEEK